MNLSEIRIAERVAKVWLRAFFVDGASVTIQQTAFPPLGLPGLFDELVKTRQEQNIS